MLVILDDLTFMENVFLTPNSPSSPSGFSKVQIFQKIVYSLRKHFFRHPGKNNRLFEENVLLIQEVCSFNPKNRHPSPDPLRLDQTINQHGDRDFDVLCWKCFFDPADRQESKQTIFLPKTLFYEREKFQKTNTRFEFLDPDYPSVNPYKNCDQAMFF